MHLNQNLFIKMYVLIYYNIILLYNGFIYLKKYKIDVIFNLVLVFHRIVL